MNAQRFIVLLVTLFCSMASYAQPTSSGSWSFCNNLLKAGIFDHTSVDSSYSRRRHLMDSYFSQEYSSDAEAESYAGSLGIPVDSLNEITAAFNSGTSSTSTSLTTLMKDHEFRESVSNQLKINSRAVSENLVGVLENCASANTNEGRLVAYVTFSSTNPSNFTVHLNYNRIGGGHVTVAINKPLVIQPGTVEIDWDNGAGFPNEISDGIPITVSGERVQNTPTKIIITANVPVLPSYISIPSLETRQVWTGKFRFEHNFPTGGSDLQQGFEIDMYDSAYDWSEKWFNGVPDGHAVHATTWGPKRIFISGMVTRRGQFGVRSIIYGPVSNANQHPQAVAVDGPFYDPSEIAQAESFSTDGTSYKIVGQKVLEPERFFVFP